MKILYALFILLLVTAAALLLTDSTVTQLELEIDVEEVSFEIISPEIKEYDKPISTAEIDVEEPPEVVETPVPITEIDIPEEIIEIVKIIEPAIVLPEPIDENAIMAAVVRIGCKDSFGSGISLKVSGKHYAVTAAHVIINTIDAGRDTCNIIFPRKSRDFDFYEEAHYRVGKILNPDQITTNYKTMGLDFAVLEIQPLEDAAEDKRVFPDGYPFVDYPACSLTNINDNIILWGYAAHVGTQFSPGGILSRFVGKLIQYADAEGVSKQSSAGFSDGYAYLPKVSDSTNETIEHTHSVIVSDNNFSGASGGLVFDSSKNCIIGLNIATFTKDNKVYGLILNLGFSETENVINSL